jgi:hypothetical protein
LAPAALWVSVSGQRIAQLYDTRDADRLVDTGLVHYESFAEVPEGMVTKTQFRKARGKDPGKAGVALRVGRLSEGICRDSDQIQ